MTSLLRKMVITFALAMMVDYGVSLFLLWSLMVFVWHAPLVAGNVKLRLVSTGTQLYDMAFTQAFRLNEAQSKFRGLVTNLVSVPVINP